MDSTPLIAYIRKYISLSHEEELILLEHMSFRKYLKGQYVVQQGDVCRYESFVLTGSLKTFYVDENGQEHVVMFAVENWWTADLGSFITQSPADYHIQCLENTSLIQFSVEDLDMLYTKLPKMERFFRIIIQKAYVALQRRIVQNFTLPAKDRYLLFLKQYPEIEKRVPQYLIASYLGITKEFLSKIRNQISSES